MKNEQRDMLQDYENAKEMLFSTREEKEEYEEHVAKLNDKIRADKQEVFLQEQTNYDLDKHLDKKNREVQDLEHQIMLIDDELNRKNKDVQQLQSLKNEIENENSRMQREFNKCRQQKQLQEEFVRRTENVNHGIKQDIAIKRAQIEHSLSASEDTKKYNHARKMENEQLLMDVEQTSKNIIILEDQNRGLEDELDRFLVSDNEIRQKLADRNRSPLRLDDLYSRAIN
jgi:chromosome segregation ATPase